jgi:glutaredoxin
MLMSRLKTAAVYATILVGGLGVGLALAKLPKLLEKRYQHGDYSTYFPDASTRVVVYGTSTCPFCAKARAHLAKQQVAFADFNVDKSAAANQQFKALKGAAVPVILIGDRLITGFQPDVIDDALRAAAQSSPRR